MKLSPSIIICALILFGAGCVQSPTTQTNLPPLNVAPSVDSDQVVVVQPPVTPPKKVFITTYKDPELGFSFSVPKGSFFEDGGTSQVRIQNYSWADDRMWLEPGEFYLEAYSMTGPDREVRTLEECNGGETGSLVSYGSGFQAWVGHGPVGGDAGGNRYLLCVLGEDETISVMVTSSEKDGAKIANSIFKSFSPAPGVKPNAKAVVE